MKTKLSLLFLLICGGFAFAGSQEQRLARFLKQYPDADANGDGRLTVEEARAYRQKLGEQAAPGRPPTQRGAPRQFTVDPGWESDRFPEHAVCYRSPQEIKAIYAKTLEGNEKVVVSYEKPTNGALRVVGTGHLGPGFDRLEGYVFYATIYARSPELIVADIPFGGSSDFPSRELDRLFRKIAWQAVVRNPLSGVTDKDGDGTGDARERASN